MRYLLILAVALALTIAWQTSVVADIPAQPEISCERAGASVAGHPGSMSKEPACR